MRRKKPGASSYFKVSDLTRRGLFSICWLGLACCLAPAALALTTTAIFPTNGATSVCADTPFQLTFDAAPTLGTSGTIKIYDSANNLLQTIDLALNSPLGTQARTIGGTTYQASPVLITGNTAHISPPSDLPYNKTIYITVDATVFPGFTGVSGTTAWRFTTRSSAPSTALDYVVVNANGTGNFATIQGAIDWVPANNTRRIILDIRDGTYREIIRNSSKHNLHLRGQNRQRTLIEYPNNNNRNPSSSTRTVFFVGSNDTILDSLTIRNSTPDGGSQAEALIVGGLRTFVQECDLRSYQDTFQINGANTAYIRDSMVEGDVDFIWGSGSPVFQNCEIRSLSSNGYVCQMRTPAGNLGAVFLDCRFTGSAGVTNTVFNRIDPDGWPFSAVAVVDCTLGSHMSAAGWLRDGTGTGTLANLRLREYRSLTTAGALVNTSQRLAPWAQLSQTEASAYRDLPAMLGGWTPRLAPRAFPSAEGNGARALGGRGGDVYYVTNLNSSGAGSFSNGIDTATGPRTILFKVAGYINGRSINKPRLTVAGQSAPGDGIAFRNRSLRVEANDVVLRHVRSRLGTELGIEDDSMGVLRGIHVIVDHCSASWSVDETLSVTDNADNVTVQWCGITESLNNSIHSKGAHGYGSLVRPNISSRVTFHHNYYAHHRSRNPRLGSYNPAVLRMEFRNNLLYNWGGTVGYSGDNTEGLELNYIGNYLLKGPSSTSNLAFDGGSATSKIYQNGNRTDLDRDGIFDGTDPGWGAIGGTFTQITTPFPAPSAVSETSPLTAQRVLSRVGARPWKRDPVDLRVTAHAITGTGAIIDSTAQVGGYPVLATAPAPVDSDNDGLPDEWELALGLPTGSADNNGDRDGDGYTNLEEYLEWLSNAHTSTGFNMPVDLDLVSANGGRPDVTAFTVSNAFNGTISLLPDSRTARFTPASGFSGLAGFQFSYTSAGQSVSLPVGVLVTPGLPSQTVWKGNTPAWDLVASNFLEDITPVAFAQGDNVLFNDSGISTTVTLTGTLNPIQVRVEGSKNYTFGGTGSLSGGMSLQKTGSGTLTLSSGHTFSGGVSVSSGKLVLGNATAAGSGTISLADATELVIGALKPANPIEVTGAVTVSGGSTGGLAGLGTVSGNGEINLNITTGVFDLTGNLTGFTGPLRLTAARDIRLNGTSGGAGLVLDLGAADGEAYNRSSGTAISFGNLRGGSATALRGASASTQTTTFTIGGNNEDSTFAGLIGNGVNATGALTAVTKVGTGRLTLSGTSTYTGPTLVSAGILHVTGTLGATAVTVSPGATLSGSGTIGSSLTVQDGGFFNFDGSGPSALNIGGNLTLNGGNLAFALQNTPAGGGDKFQLSGGAVVLNGIITVTPELLGGPLLPGTYTLISGAASVAVNGTLVWGGESGGRQSVAFDTSTPGSLRLIVTGTPASLVWAGTPGTLWDSGIPSQPATGAANWLNAGLPDRFVDLDAVLFNDTATTGAVTITTPVAPRSLTVANPTRAYTLSGRPVAGATSLVKSGAATLTLAPTSVTLATTTTLNSPTATVTSAAGLEVGMIVLGPRFPSSTTILAIAGNTLTLSKNATATATTNHYFGISNSYTGGTTLGGGTLKLGSDIANASALGSGPITFQGGTLEMNSTINESQSSNWDLVVPVGAAGILKADPRCDIAGSLTGGGNFNIQAGFFRTDISADWTAFTGQLDITTDADGGGIRIANSYVPFDLPDASVNLGPKAELHYAGIVNTDAGTFIRLGSLSGDATSKLYGGPTAARICTWQIGGKNTDTIFSGTIVEQSASTITAFDKVGSGTLRLTGFSDHRGGTTVSEGRLIVNGSITASTMSVKSGATLGGTGQIAACNLLAEATLSPGENGAGTLTTGPLSLNADSYSQFDLGSISDRVIVIGDLALNGVITLVDTGTAASGSHILFTHTGALTGSATLNPPPGFIATLDTFTPGEVRVNLTATSFITWAQGYFTAAELANPSISGRNASPAGDGLSNLLKYSLGLSPKVPSTTGITFTQPSNAWLFTYARPALRPDISYSVEVSPSLNGNSWTTEGVTHVRSVTGDPETWTASAVAPVSGKLFFRLKVLQLP
jgi:autotransporter-associated beta strand protein